jgi:hypothetical protein
MQRESFKQCAHNSNGHAGVITHQCPLLLTWFTLILKWTYRLYPCSIFMFYICTESYEDKFCNATGLISKFIQNQWESSKQCAHSSNGYANIISICYYCDLVTLILKRMTGSHPCTIFDVLHMHRKLRGYHF